MLRRILPFAAIVTSCSFEVATAPRVGARESLDHRAPDEVVLDIAANEDAIVGRVEPAPEDSDADRVLTIRWLTGSGARSWRFGGTQALEARFVPRSSAVLVVTVQHTLVRLDRADAEGAVIDHDVLGPLSMDDAGRWVVYTRGEMAAYEVMRAEIATGRTEQMAPDLVPAWCPAITPDGQSVVVVASSGGRPALFRLRQGQPAERWGVPENIPLPTGPAAPLWVDGTFVYESDGALHSLRPDGTHVYLPGLGLPVRGGATPVLAQDPTNHLTPLTARELGAQ
ncbi:MAG: hypothetical protein WCJ30_11445 [Deltaproteobacteria bacterium]